MKKYFVMLPAALLSGCVVFPVGGPASGTCFESEIDTFIGMRESALVATKVVMTVRILYPDTPITEEFSPDRANFMIGADGIISDAFCG